MGAVERCRRGALHDFDALDVVGLDVVHRQRALTRRRRERSALAVDANAIHVHDRRIALRDAVRTAQANGATRARLSGILHHRDARSSPGENVLRVLDRLDLDWLHVDRRHRIADFFLARFRSRSGDDHGI